MKTGGAQKGGSSLTDIVLISPLEPDLDVMAFEDSVIKFLQKLIGLVLGKLINLLRKWPHGVDALPTGHWVGPHDRVNSGQVRTGVQWATSRVGVNDNIGICLRSLEEAIANIVCSLIQKRSYKFCISSQC